MGVVEQLQLYLGKWEKLNTNLGDIKNIYINWKHLGEVHQPNLDLPYVPEFHFSEIFKMNSSLMTHCYEIIPLHGH